MLTIGKPLLLLRFGVALLIGALAAPVSPARGERLPPPNEFEDDTIRVLLPAGWSVAGAGGEYRLESPGTEIGSLLLLSPEAERGFEERLADIEAQFLSTGVFRLEASETRTEDGTPIHYRRYRLVPAASGEEDRDEHESTLLHQYSFVRAGVQVLLQIEAAPGRWSPEDVAFRVFHTLEVRRTPDPFRFDDPAEGAGAGRADADGG
jgi:hypothetical protein